METDYRVYLIIGQIGYDPQDQIEYIITKIESDKIWINQLIDMECGGWIRWKCLSEWRWNLN